MTLPPVRGFANGIAPPAHVVPPYFINDHPGPPPNGHHSPRGQPGGHHSDCPVPRGLAPLLALHGPHAPVRLSGSFTRLVRNSRVSRQPPSTQSCFIEEMCSSCVDGAL